MVIIAINIFFVYNTVQEWEPGTGPVVGIVIVGVLYLLFCIYLAIHLVVAMGNKRLGRVSWVQKYVTVDDSKLNLDI